MPRHEYLAQRLLKYSTSLVLSIYIAPSKLKKFVHNTDLAPEIRILHGQSTTPRDFTIPHSETRAYLDGQVREASNFQVPA